MPANSRDRFTLDKDLLAGCNRSIQHGSKSFMVASRLLPRPIREASRALYAYCRAADDLIDESPCIETGLAQLKARTARIYSGTPEDFPEDRAFAAVVAHFAIPKTLPDALGEGFAWDAEARRYETLEDLAAYAARVASSVGVMMSMIMGVTDRNILARAADLGLAMQLTNIARDVGEDAARGRLYLPENWLLDAGLDPQEFLRNPSPKPEILQAVHRLLGAADELYSRAVTGIAGLPSSCRIAIYSAALIYREIGTVIAANGYDSVTRRAVTSRQRKLALVAQAAGSPWLFQTVATAPAHATTQFMVDAASVFAQNDVKGLTAKAGRMVELMLSSELRRRESKSMSRPNG
ncbi:phytoene synthase [Roseibium aquae]|uniref:Phytoene synthase n=1 Tax=Roseibium aquae TaxID=1323746 RepID=A0A916T8J1_9HYPH|nr:phytoene/squalene synthase family protein [Roseibium aquae]GGB33942.1 phytoene synthase [Roseibium aquae]